jgi:Tfp pilus assembly PilM family ATPase
MPRLVAIEWDQTEIRALVARTRGGSVDLEQVVTLPLVGERPTPQSIGNQLHDALKAASATGLEAIVAVGRTSIELRFLTVPPVPADELPDLVRFQATRQFSQPIEEGLLDYAPLATSGDPPTSVLAAAISSETLQAVREVCDGAKVTLKHLVLRPFAADSLVTDRLDADSCVLTVDRLSEEVDLTVVLGGQAVFPRSVRVPQYGTEAEQAATMVGEMRRTIAAASNQIGGQPVQSVLILGAEAEQKALADAVVRDLSLPVSFVDPLESVTASAKPPRGVGRFAPLIGALVDEARGRRPEIDFLAPRKRPAPPDRRRTYILAGSAVAALVLAVVGFAWWQLSSLDAEIAELANQSKALDAQVKASKPVVDRTAEVDKYIEGRVTWLNELRELATDLPPAETVILDELSTTVAGGAKLSIVGGAIKQDDVPALELKLADERHRIRGRGTNVNEKNAPYSATFTADIELIDEKAETGKSAPPPKAPAAKAKGAAR